MAPADEIDGRAVLAFLAIAFGVSWAIALLVWASGVPVGGALSPLLAIMFGPAVAALVLAYREGGPVADRLGLQLERPRWLVYAWLVPLALVGGTIAIGVALPGVAVTTDLEAFFVGQGLSEDVAETAATGVDELPVPFWLVLVVSGLLAGGSVNLLFALGEELGWRGWLLDELAPLGFWRCSAVTGVAWGVWHAPIVLQGHNFPESPVVGVGVMTVATLALSPLYTYVTVRAGSVAAAGLLHGTFNALGALSIVYLTGATNLWIAPVGVAGIVAALLADVACLVHDRLVADEPITTGEPLSPWGDPSATGRQRHDASTGTSTD